MSIMLPAKGGYRPNVDSAAWRIYMWGRCNKFVSSVEGRRACFYRWLVFSVPFAWFFQAQLGYRWMSPVLATFALALLGYIGANIAVQPAYVAASALEGTLSALFSVGLMLWLMRKTPNGEMTVYDGGAFIIVAFAFMGPFMRRFTTDGNVVTFAFFAGTAAAYLLALAWIVLFPFKRQVGSAIAVPFVWIGQGVRALYEWACPPVIPPEPDPYPNNP